MSSKKYTAPQDKLWYNQVVSAITEKKDQPLALRVPVSLLQRIEEIAVSEDRPVGYVARELMIRGLGLYEQDGRLRDMSPTEKVFDRSLKAAIPGLKTVKVRHEGEVNDELPSSNAHKKASQGSRRKIKAVKK